MTRTELLDRLRELADLGDEEVAHSLADDALLEFIGDREITEAWRAIKKWFA